MSPLTRRAKLASALAIVATAVLASSITVALANHNFPDVPTGSPFHNQIDNIFDARCATGFPDGTFRRQDSVNRQQFAFWMNNCGTRSAFTTLPNVATFDTTFDTVETHTITTGGGEPGGTQYLQVWGTYVVNDAGNGCPCDLSGRISATPSGGATVFGDENIVGVTETAGGDVDDSITVIAWFSVNSNTTYTIDLDARIFNSDSGEVSMTLEDTQLLTMSAPFGSGGGNPQLHSESSEPEESVPLNPSGNPNG